MVARMTRAKKKISAARIPYRVLHTWHCPVRRVSDRFIRALARHLAGLQHLLEPTRLPR
jgi:predicted RNA polymerase sigma factor